MTILSKNWIIISKMYYTIFIFLTFKNEGENVRGWENRPNCLTRSFVDTFEVISRQAKGLFICPFAFQNFTRSCHGVEFFLDYL